MNLRTRSITLPGGLPTEFCIFKAGENDSCKGTAIFDSASAAAVMNAYTTAGVDMMIDLEHQAILAPDARADSSDARGWAKLEMRPDGSLWAVGVTWTPDGAQRLADKTQRYISPAFYSDDEGRVLELINCAIVAMPATYDATALVAASRRSLARAKPAATVRSNTMDPEQLKAAIDALTNGSIAKALGLDPAATPADIQKALTSAVAALGGGTSDDATDPAAPDPATAETPDDPKPTTNVASRLAALETRMTEDPKMLARLNRLEAEATARDLESRRDLIAELVTLGVELPATAWAGDAAKRVPAAHLAAESIESMTNRVAAYRAAPRPQKITPPADGVTVLSKDEEAATAKMTPAQKEKFIALRTSRRAV